MQKFLMVGVGLAVAVLAATGAQAAEKRLSVAAFHGLRTSAGIEVDASIGPASVVAVGADEDLARLKVEVRDGVLVFSRQSWWGRSGPIRVQVQAPSLDRFEASSSGEIRADGLSGGIVAEASSGGEVRLSGACSSLRAEASSGAEIDAQALRCASVEASASSGANVGGYASAEVNASASSGGDVMISGNPKSVQKSSSSGGEVRIGG